MKYLLILLSIAAISFASCNNPDGKVYSSFEQFEGKWEHGQPVNQTYVIIAPTWGQSFYFAFKSGYASSFITGLILLGWLVFCVRMISAKLAATRAWNITYIVTGLIAAPLSLLLLIHQPSDIKENNFKNVKAEEYEAVKNDLPAYWLQMYDDNRIIGAGHKKKN